MKAIQTQSIMIQNLCVPCFNRCRYCLLSWDGKPVGTAWERGAVLAERYISELRAARPGVNVSYVFGYSMEHPELRKAIQTLRRLGSPTADTCLLKNHLTQPDGIGIGSMTPRQIAPVLLEPAQYGRGKGMVTHLSSFIFHLSSFIYHLSSIIS